MWMNEYEIDEALETLKAHAPDYAKYAQFLSDWRDTVNANSDGWAYWRTGSKCADRLSELVDKAVQYVRGREDEAPSHADFKRALTPIRSLASKRDLPQPKLQDPPAAGPRM